MDDFTPGLPEDAEENLARLAVRAELVADRAHRTISVFAALDEEVLVFVFGLNLAAVRTANAYSVFGIQAGAPDLAEAIAHCSANMLRGAAALRKRGAESEQFDPRIQLLLSDLQVLHREADFLQKFLLAPDPLADLARKAYAKKYLAAASELEQLEVHSAPPDDDFDSDSPEPADEINFDDEEAADELRELERELAEIGGATREETSACDLPLDRSVSPGNKVTVTCRHCGKRFAANREMVGKRVRCLSCQRPIRISAASTNPPAAAPKNAAPATLTNASREQTSSEKPAEKIRIACGSCRQQFFAPSSMAGRSVKCSACGQSIAVPHAELDAAMLTGLAMDPLADLGSLDDYTSPPYPRPDNARQRPTSGHAYFPESSRYRDQDEEMPRWVWYAMGGALGICLLVFITIVVRTTLYSTSSQDTAPPAAESRESVPDRERDGAD